MIRRIIGFKTFACVLLIILTFLIYAQVIYFDFINIDDKAYVTDNKYIKQGLTISNVIWAFKTTFGGFWQPVTGLSHMLDIQLYGMWAGGHHLTSLLLHIANSMLLLIIFNRMTGAFWRSWFIASLFALHPLHVESVAWIAERRDVLSAFFWMLTMYAYSYYVVHPCIRRYLIVLLFFCLGLMAKPMLVTLPFVLLLLDFWPFDRCRYNQSNNGHLQRKGLIAPESASIYRLILEKIPFIALIIPMSIITYFSVAHFGAFTSSDSYLLHMRIGNALVSYIHYLGKMSLPLSLSIYYPYIGTWPIWQVTLYGFILAAFSSFVLWKVTRYPYLAVGWLWYLGTLIPVIGLVQVGDHAMADRYTYIPLIGIFIMIAWGVPDLLSQYPYRKAVISFFSILIILLLSFLSWQRCQLWGDKVALWSDALKNHQVPFAYNIRGLDYEKRGQHQKAIEDFNHALMIKPNFAEALNNRANSYATIGQYDQAFRDYNKSLVFKPHDADTFYNRGILHLKNRHFESATGDFTEAIRIRPEMADAFNNRGTSLSAQKRYIEAIADYNTATRINPHHIQALHNLGIILMNMKKYDDAAIQFEKIMKINPADQDAMQKLNTIARLKHQP